MKILWKQGTQQRNENSRLVLLSLFMCSNEYIRNPVKLRFGKKQQQET